jgi:hypothetical protein
VPAGSFACCRMLLGILATFLAVIPAFAQRNGPHETPCTDIKAVDFKNTTIQYGTRTFAFHDGVALNYDMPEVSRVPDWKAEIIRDQTVEPTAGTYIRFLLIEDNHETGSGSYNYLIGFRCSAGKVSEVFRRKGISLGLDRLDDSGVTVGLNPIYGKLVRKHWAYVWDRETQKYRISSSWETAVDR